VDNLNRVTQKTSWIFLEQPTGTGYSVGKSRVTSNGAAEDVVDFLGTVLSMQFPYKGKHVLLLGRPLHIAGESYAGHYVPAVGAMIVDKSLTSFFNLKSVMIGNGFVDAVLLIGGVEKLFCGTHPILTAPVPAEDLSARCGEMAAWRLQCLQAINNCRGAVVYCPVAYAACEELWGFKWAPFLEKDIYDFTKPASRERMTFYSGPARSFVKDRSKSWGADKTISWSAVSNVMTSNFKNSGDWFRSYQPELERILNENINVLLYGVSTTASSCSIR
jgi:cathepsin A (carboxypeptidase C)